MPEVSVPDFKDNTAYPGINDPFNDPIVRWFWTCVENMSGEERARLLQFVTGSSQVPPGGFKTLEPKINIKLNHSPPSHLPVSHTCFNTLELPRYDVPANHESEILRNESGILRNESWQALQVTLQSLRHERLGQGTKNFVTD